MRALLRAPTSLYITTRAGGKTRAREKARSSRSEDASAGPLRRRGHLPPQTERHPAEHGDARPTRMARHLRERKTIARPRKVRNRCRSRARGTLTLLPVGARDAVASRPGQCGALRRVAMKTRYLFIVARRVPMTYATMRDTCRRYVDIDVILDRRHGQRRRLTLPTAADRRWHERRSRKIDVVLKQLGWVVVTQTADPAGGESAT